MREHMNPHKDAKVFTRTAQPRKVINLRAVTYRGGIRL